MEHLDDETSLPWNIKVDHSSAQCDGMENVGLIATVSGRHTQSSDTHADVRNSPVPTSSLSHPEICTTAPLKWVKQKSTLVSHVNLPL